MSSIKCPQCGSTDVKEITVPNSSKSSDLFSMIIDIIKGSIKGSNLGHTIQSSYINSKASTSYDRKYRCKHCGKVWK